MSRRRRALLLLLLAALLGSLAAANVRRREAAIERALGPGSPVLVTRAAIAAGAPLGAARPLLRILPRRFAPPDAVISAAALIGARAAVALPAGSYVTAATLRAAASDAAAPAVRAGERVADVVARADPGAVVAGAHVDVLVTHEPSGQERGATVLALTDVAVLAAHPAPPAAGDDEGGARVVASLRVSVRDAVYLAAAQTFARDLRLLARAPGDRGGARAGLAVDDRLR
jgi:pilus assembly protein CpaB